MTMEPSSRLTETELRALIEVVAIVAYADGSLSRPELNALSRRVEELGGASEMAEHLADFMAEVRPAGRPEGDSRARRLRELGQALGSDALRQKAFEIAVEVARADDRVGVREAASLAAAAAELGLEAHVALELYGSGVQHP